MRTILKIDNLKYKNIIKNISLDIEENSFNVLLGPSGSGKTTLVKSLARILKYDGSILFNGEKISKKSIRGKIGILMDNHFLIDGTCLYNITYPLLNLDYDELSANKEAYEISKKLDVEYLLTKNIKEISVAEKKIVAFMQALIHKPEIIVIDDSFEELDNYYRNKIVNYLKNEIKSTIIFVSNNEEDILLSDNLIILNSGELAYFGKTSEAINDENLFIKNNIKLPFLADLSHKLKAYNLVNDVVLNIEDLVNIIWK